MATPRPSQNLLEGRRSLEHLPFCQMMSDLQWFDVIEKWALILRIKVDPNDIIPEWSSWYLLCGHNYPLCDISIFPAKDEGIVQTFPHQLFNGIGDPNIPWRTGKICEHTSLRTFGRRIYDVEPYTNSEQLAWHVSRLYDWLIAAKNNRLNENGDPFELPHFPLSAFDTQIAFIEDKDSFDFWQKDDHHYGFVDFSNPAANPNILAATQFNKKAGQLLRKLNYGDTIPSKIVRSGLWIRTKDVPRILPWQAPSTFSELIRALSETGVDIEQILQILDKNIRDGERHPLIIGFPISSTIGSPPVRYHWQGLLLPMLSFGSVNGFRSSEKGYSLRDKSFILTPRTKIDWLRSANWDESEIRTRGSLPDSIISKRILIIGSGAIGCMIAELLAREGCCDFIIVDDEKLEIGNLARHSLDLLDIGFNKAQRLASRIITINPHICAIPIPKSFPPSGKSDHTLLQSCDCVIDCTADDMVLHDMSTFQWKTDKQFISVSVGLFAKRLFIFSSYGNEFPYCIFQEKIHPWIEKEKKEYAGVKLPREGIGCWHPVFPARADDLWLASSISIKRIESIISVRNIIPTLEVFEQEFDNKLFNGIQKVA